jgi:hypothetical protein
VRDRRSPGAARLQLKWLVSATAAVVIVYALVVSVSVYAEGQTPLWLMVLQDAATFQPLRTRIQAVDRRFYRRREGAERAASVFTSRLRGRSTSKR